MRTFLIDTDTASDDAVALIMALRAPQVRVAAITTVAGNVGVEQATRNALYTIELCGADVPVYAGAGKPLVREHQSAAWFQGTTDLAITSTRARVDLRVSYMPLMPSSKPSTPTRAS